MLFSFVILRDKYSNRALQSTPLQNPERGVLSVAENERNQMKIPVSNIGCLNVCLPGIANDCHKRRKKLQQVNNNNQNHLRTRR